MAKEMLGAYAESELVKRIERECKLDFNRPKSQMVVVLLTEALDARESIRNPKRKASK
jgi:hypothetical protein